MRTLFAAAAIALHAALLWNAPAHAIEEEEKQATPEEVRNIRFVDLQGRANHKLSTDFHGYEGNNLKPLPRGRQTMGDVEFEIGEKLIQLASKRAPDFPEKVTGIQVGQSANRLHFLHGTGWGSPGLDDGTPIGSYVVHFEDGESEVIPIEYGRDMRDWWALGESSPATRAKVAWTGVNDASKDFRGYEVKIRLFCLTWSNPHPQKKIQTIDFVSRNETISAPFLVALTAETIVDEAATIEKLKEAGVFLEFGDDEKVKLVSLSGPGLQRGPGRGNDENLNLASDLPSVQVVYANFSDITDEGLACLQKLPNLRWLSLNLTQISDQGLAHLAKLKGLERLRLHKTQISDAGLAHLTLLDKLQVLDLSATAISDEGLAILATMPSLKKLDLHGTKVTDAGVAKFKESMPSELEITR